ncbi:MobA/MobL family protein, partial [Acidithiobacillus thiooxidans]|uniref:MobA/MobL family protein n=1 Tax=Acidithiobacillus thiooxidans TaxID=930 RepID=UPI001C073104
MAEYHLHAKTHNRGVGKGAGGHVRYILREGAYAQKVVEQIDGNTVKRASVSRAGEVLHAESGHLPAWAQTAADYWDAADQYERKNGTVYRELEFALPQELPEAVNVLLAHDFAERLSAVEGGHTPYTLAIHRSERDASLLHCHLMLSDKINDGIARDPALWFKRAAVSPKNKNPVDPARGGAPKTQARIGQDWLGTVVRPLWAELANQALEHAGYSSIRIDHRSLEVQRQEAEQQAARLWEQGDHGAHRAALERVIALDRPPQPKRGRVLTHAGAAKAPDRAAMVLGYEAHKQARQAAAQAAAQAHREALALEKALHDAEQVLERARLRQGYRRDSWEIRERWAFRQQERVRRREEERLLEEHAQREREEQALDDRVAAETAPGVRYPQRSRWREWRAQTLSRKYDPVYSAEMAKRDIYCRWMPEHGGLYLRLGQQEVIDQGPLLLAKNGALDIPLLIETAQGKGWETLTFT